MKKLFLSMMAIAIAAGTFTSCEDVPEPYNNPYQNMGTKVTVEPTGDGTLASPFNVAAALAKCEEVGEDGTATEVYATGYVTELTEVSASYGNATFKIADSKEGGDALTVYRAKGFNGENITDENILHTGDSVVICGKLVNFKGNTPEFTQGCYIVSINGQGGGGSSETKTVGTKESPKTVAEALAAINALETENKDTEESWYIKGKVKQVITTDANITQYKNIDYIISDDGTNELKVFRGKYIDNADFTVDNKVKVNDEVIILGKLQKYVKDNVTTPEVTNSAVVVLNGTGGGSGNTGTPQGSGTQADPFNVAAIVQEAGKLEAGQTSTDDYYFKGKICSIKYTFSAQYGTATFNISDDGKTGGTEFICYSVYTFGNQAWVDGNTQVAVNDEVIICGKITNYNGTLETASKKAYIYSLNGKTENTTGGGTQGGGTDTETTDVTGTGTVSGNTLTINATEFGFAKGNATSTTLTDGTKIFFDKGSGSTAPAYYDGDYASVRVYANNTVTIKASKKITKIEITTTDPSSSDKYNGSDGAYAEGGSTKVNISKDSDTKVSFSGLNSAEVKITNYNEANSKNQLRIKQMVITYAE